MSQQEFNQALLAAQKEFPTIAKTKTATIPTNSGSYSYKYADLGDVLDQALPILHKHGLALSQPGVSRDGRLGVLTRLVHQSGYSEDCGEVLLPAGNTPQAAGSAITYARRYGACAALGIVADEDDDAASVTRAIEDPYQDPDEPMPKATNQLKADLLKQVGGDTALAAEIWTRSTEVLGVPADQPLPHRYLALLEVDIDARATEAMASAD